MDYTPKPEHKFTFGLWTVGNIGRDPFGEPVRSPISPVELVHLLGEVGAYGVNFHDNDLVPIDVTAAERNRIVRDFKQALQATGLGVELGAQTYVFWGGREGTETDAAKNPLDAGKRFREALNFLCEYVIDQKY